MGVLCSILLSPRETLTLCIEKIDERHFHQPAHATIYALLIELWKESKPIDLVTVTQALADAKLLDSVGGPSALAQLIQFVPTATNADYYLDILREKFLLRSMITVCTGSAVRCYEEQGDVKTLVDDIESEIFKISESRVTQVQPGIKDQVLLAIDAIEGMHKNKGILTGLSTGFAHLDQMTDGMHPSEMLVIAARPSMGKTAIAMNIAEHVAMDQDKAVGIFSLEMSSQQLVQRMLCSRARVDLKKVRDGFMGNKDMKNLSKAADALAKSKIYIDDTAGLSILELRAKARRLKDRHDLSLIVIDYLQLLRSTTKRGQENRQIEIAEISNGIKALAKELSIPVIVLAQLNRESEKRSDGKPRISDLRESGSIEQDADVVGLLYRSSYFEKDDAVRSEKEGEAELIIAKQRNGPVGEVPLTFLKEYTRFETRAYQPEEG
ncbi:MAG: replicative DNA helicase [Verrucomicrobia bacterium RIFCSPHIGHO2_12_FULL_41_10]|nr:MAG: replicative DNA helicase [Verrucomicrobia bacterium RIFCSPHIGHO2_12_FULL_41_10]